MRRVSQPRLNTETPEERATRRRRGPLAIRPPDEHAREPPLRMIHALQQYPHMRQIKLVRRSLRQLVAKREHAVDCGLVRHKEAFSCLVSSDYQVEIISWKSGFGGGVVLGAGLWLQVDS